MPKKKQNKPKMYFKDDEVWYNGFCLTNYSHKDDGTRYITHFHQWFQWQMIKDAFIVNVGVRRWVKADPTTQKGLKTILKVRHWFEDNNIVCPPISYETINIKEPMTKKDWDYLLDSLISGDNVKIKK